MDNSTQFNPAAETLISAVVASEVETQVLEAKLEKAEATPQLALQRNSLPLTTAYETSTTWATGN